MAWAILKWPSLVVRMRARGFVLVDVAMIGIVAEGILGFGYGNSGGSAFAFKIQPGGEPGNGGADNGVVGKAEGN